VHQWRILLDLDGTVAQNAGRRLAERQFGIPLSDSRSGDTPLWELLGITVEQFWAWWHENQEEIYGQASPLPGASETLHHLKGAGSYIAVVTARRDTAEAVTASWLAANAIPYDTMVMNADDKVSVARALNLNVGFEDDPHHALPLADLMPMVLMENLKNRNQEIDHPQVHRVTSWPDALPLLRRLAAQSA
jgi:uncharacterized HAD superfamily protein